MMPPAAHAPRNLGVIRLIDMIFPGDTNHHGTLFGGTALAHMDKVAFLAASRHGRATFVTAASERIYGISFGGNPNDVLRGMGGDDLRVETTVPRNRMPRIGSQLAPIFQVVTAPLVL